MIKCRHCGYGNDAANKECEACGAVLSNTSTVSGSNLGFTATPAKPSLQELTKEALPSIVAIETVFLDVEKRKPFASAGTGFIIDGGYIVSNSHVVEGVRLSPTTATFDSSVDSVTYNLRVVTAVPEADLAILRFEDDLMDKTVSRQKHLQLRVDPPVQLGEPVYTLGNARGLGISVTDGVVSHPARQLQHRGVKEIIQISVPITHGSSGGPLLDYNNRVVGVTSGGFDDKPGADLAIPAHQVATIINRLKLIGESED